MVTKWESSARRQGSTFWSGKKNIAWDTMNTRTIICEKTGTLSNSWVWLQTSQIIGVANRMMKAAAREINKYKNNRYIVFTITVTDAVLSSGRAMLSHNYIYFDFGTEYTYSFDRTGGTDKETTFYDVLSNIGTVISFTGAGLTEYGLQLEAGSAYQFKCDKAKITDSYSTLTALALFPFNIAGFFEDKCTAGDYVTLKVDITGADA